MLLFSQIVVAPCMQQQCQLLKRWTTLPAGNCALLSLSMARLVLFLPQCHLQILQPSDHPLTWPFSWVRFWEFAEVCKACKSQETLLLQMKMLFREYFIFRQKRGARGCLYGFDLCIIFQYGPFSSYLFDTFPGFYAAGASMDFVSFSFNPSLSWFTKRTKVAMGEWSQASKMNEGEASW